MKLISEGPPSYRGSASLRCTATGSACRQSPHHQLPNVTNRLHGKAQCKPALPLRPARPSRGVRLRRHSRQLPPRCDRRVRPDLLAACSEAHEAQTHRLNVLRRAVVPGPSATAALRGEDATRLPGDYPDRTHTGTRRRASDQVMTAEQSPPDALGAHNRGIPMLQRAGATLAWAYNWETRSNRGSHGCLHQSVGYAGGDERIESSSNVVIAGVRLTITTMVIRGRSGVTRRHHGMASRAL
jgi:hypothetical protein